jgi:hypothetical protein
MIFSATDRDLSHQFLAAVLEQIEPPPELVAALAGHIGAHPRAECREDPNAALPYQVWSGPA